MNDGDTPGAVLVGMGVRVGRWAVGTPTGVTDAQRRVGSVPGNGCCEFRNLAFPLADGKTVRTLDGDAGGVVAAILQICEPGEQVTGRVAYAHAPSYPTH